MTVALREDACYNALNFTVKLVLCFAKAQHETGVGTYVRLLQTPAAGFNRGSES